MPLIRNEDYWELINNIISDEECVVNANADQEYEIDNDRESYINSFKDYRRINGADTN